MDNSYIQIGRLKKAYGNDGGIRIVFFKDVPTLSNSNNHFFVSIDGIYVPFFPIDMSELSKGICHLEGISSIEQTSELAGKHIYLKGDNSVKSKPEDSNLPFHFLIGFELLSEKNESIGRFKNIEQYPMQLMGTLENGTLIPINDQNIKTVNKEEKTIVMNIPEGLLDI